MQTEEQVKALLDRPLDYPGLVQRRGARERFRIWRRPAFDPETVWAVISDDSGDWFVRRVVHTRHFRGGEIFHDTFGAEGSLSERVAVPLLRRLTAIPVVPLVERDAHLIVLDGACHGIEIRDSRYCFSVSWHCAAPPEWHPLRDWFAAAVGALESALPPSSAPLQVNHPWVE
jgi:hypothetical protein